MTVKIWKRHLIKSIHILSGGIWIGLTVVLFFAQSAIITALAVLIILTSISSGIIFLIGAPKLLTLRWVRVKISLTLAVIGVAYLLHYVYPFAIPFINLTLLIYICVESMQKRNFVIGKHADIRAQNQWKPDTCPIKIPQ